MKKNKKDRKNKLIRTTRHNFPWANTGKKKGLEIFLAECKDVAQQILDLFWDTRIEWTTERFFDIQKDKLDIPMVISTVSLPVVTNLSARVLKCLATQVLGFVRAVTEVRRRRLFVRNQLKAEGKDFSKLQAKLDKPLTKPVLPNEMNVELSSLCADFQATSKKFCGFVRLHCLGADKDGNKFGEINLPIRGHRRQKHWAAKGTVMNSFLIGKKFLNIRWEVEKPELKTEGGTVGADQGIVDVLTLSDGQVSGKTDKDGHTLSSIQKKLARKQKGSKAFARAQEHRENFINWSINQLSFTDIREIRMEKVFNLRKGKKTDRFRSHWTFPLIQEKVQSKAEEAGVRVKLQSNAFRSQRCSQCGFVFGPNRNGKVFQCHCCGFTEDADLNASWNHMAEIPEIRWSQKLSDLAKGTGFFWLEELWLPEAKGLASGVRSPWFEKVVEFKWPLGGRIPQNG